MSRGYSRDEANSKAQAAVSAGVTYDGAYFFVRVEAGDSEALEAVQAMCEKIATAVKSIAEAATAASNAIMAALPSLAEMARRKAAE
jgi:hypothetical protein